MYIREAHIQIEQGLQNIGVFAYSDMLPEELDLKINNKIWDVLEEDFTINEKNKKFSVIQASLDKYQTLIEKEIELPLTKDGNIYEAELPKNYYHLIKDKSVVLYECRRAHVKSGYLKAGEWYKVKGRDITYNGQLYTKGDIFKAIENVVGYVASESNVCEWLIKLQRQDSPNRLTEEQIIDVVNENALTQTSFNRPLSTVAKNKIFVYSLDFFVEKLYISYLRKPNLANSLFNRISAGTQLDANKEYEVIKGSVIYNGTQYLARPQFQLDSFVSIGGSFSGDGILRVKGDGDIDLPRQIAQQVINKVIIDLAATTEQNQQKVVNLAQLNNVSS